ncbi:MAG: PAS domain S-box protein [Fibrobacteres bacterium]|nr:PAS domain S-box protein [Fibrobacterota bacterium]
MDKSNEVDLKKAKEKAEESETKFRAILENSRDAIGVSVKGTHVFCNPAYLKLFGFVDNNELVGTPILDRFPKSHRDQIFQNIQNRATVMPSPSFYESRCIKKDGTEFDIDMNVATFELKGEKYSVGIIRDITARKQAEEALRISKDMLSETEKIGKVGGWSFNIDTMKQTWTDEVYRIHELEISPNPSIEQGINYYTAESRPIIEKAVKRAIEFGEEYDLDLEIITAKGNRRAVHAIGKADLKNRRIYGFFQDITDRKRTEEALRNSEEKYRLQFLNMNSYNSLYEVVTDKDGKPCDFRFIMVNHAYEKYVGKTADELIGKTLLEVYPETEQYWIDKMAEVATTGVPSWFENYSKVMNTHTEINLFVPQKGQLAMTTGNIDDRKKAENALRVREAMHSKMISNIGDVIVIIDQNGINRYKSPNIEKWFGWTPEDVLGRSAFDNVHPDDLEKGQAFIGALALIPSGSDTTEVRYRCKDGTYKWIEITIVNLLHDTSINGFLGNYHDITEKKKAEAEKEKMDHQLNQMQKLESLGVFAGGIAHDFNNLLQGIFASIELAKIYSKDEKSVLSLSKAMETLGRASNLSQQLLTFAKGGAPIKKAGPLFPILADAAKFALSGSQVLCNFSIDDALWNCNFDENQLSQVIDNIVINGQQAMPLGGSIDISARNIILNDGDKFALKAGKYIKISIKDHGTGIPAEHMSKIFDPFFTTKSKGHGLGLPTCYSIISRHDGLIEVESEIGKGSVFHIYLPAIETCSLPKSNIANIEHKGRGRALLMDDEEVLRETIGEMLKYFGYTVITASTGEEAVKIFETEKEKGNDFSVLIFDLTVPGSIGGIGAIEQIRKICKSTPAIVISGYSEKGVITNPLEYGFTASLNKPFNLESLRSILSKTVVPASS